MICVSVSDEDVLRSLLIDAQASIEEKVKLRYYERGVPVARVRALLQKGGDRPQVQHTMLLEIYQSKQTAGIYREISIRALRSVQTAREGLRKRPPFFKIRVGE